MGQNLDASQPDVFTLPLGPGVRESHQTSCLELSRPSSEALGTKAFHTAEGGDREVCEGGG